MLTVLCVLLLALNGVGIFFLMRATTRAFEAKNTFSGVCFFFATCTSLFGFSILWPVVFG